MTLVFGQTAETYFNLMYEHDPAKSPLDIRCILKCCQVQKKPVESACQSVSSSALPIIYYHVSSRSLSASRLPICLGTFATGIKSSGLIVSWPLDVSVLPN